MKKFPSVLAVLFTLLLVAGCSTPESRIKKEPEAFARLSPEQQTLIKQGKVALGFDPEMVKLALGDPDNIRTRVDASGTTEVWHYVTYYTDTGYMIYGGYYHRYYGGYYGTGPWGGWGGAWGYPMGYGYTGVSVPRDRFRVEFREGKVISIEQET